MIGLNYSVVRCVGCGGMGEVHEVEHAGFGVRYALKTFAYDGEDFGEMLKTKFFEEGQMLARLKHPHLIGVFDLAMDAAGVCDLYDITYPHIVIAPPTTK